MSVKRRLRGFERAGSMPCEDLGLPRTRARSLLLSVAWRRVAGDAIARRAHAASISRGVLEIHVDGHWLETVRSLIPRLAGRLAAMYPGLGVRRVRLLRAGSSRAERSKPVVPLVDDTTDAPPPPVGVEPVDSEAEQAPRHRLERVVRRYLDRGADRDA